MIASFRSAAPTEAKHLDQGPRQIKAKPRLPRKPFEVDEITFDILHRLAAASDQMMVGFEIAFHQQRGSMRTHFPQEPVSNE